MDVQVQDNVCLANDFHAWHTGPDQIHVDLNAWHKFTQLVVKNCINQQISMGLNQEKTFSTVARLRW
jgi:hypothetical protein